MAPEDRARKVLHMSPAGSLSYAGLLANDIANAIRDAEDDALELAALQADEERIVFERAVQRYVDGAKKSLQSGDMDAYHRAHNEADLIKERIITVCVDIAMHIRALKHKDVE